MELKLSINSWHSKLYDYIYNKSNPNNLCGYFWGLLFAIFVFILLFPFGYLFKRIKEFTTPMSLSLNIVSYIFCFFILYLPIVQNEFSALFALLAVLITGSIVIGGMYSYHTFKEKRLRYYRGPSKLSKEVTEIKSIISESIKAFKGKYCPKITWKND